MKQDYLIKKVEEIRDKLYNYIFLFVDMKDAKPEYRLNWKGSYESLYRQCENDFRQFEVDINVFYNILIFNIITKLYEYDFDLQIKLEQLANQFNCIETNIRHMVIKL